MLRLAPAKLAAGYGRSGYGAIRGVALDVAQATVPRYRTRFSKHQFTQPQLLAILCLMRYEDWTFREAEVRLPSTRNCAVLLGCVRFPTTQLCIASCGGWTKPPSLML